MGSKILFKLVFINIVIVTGWAVFAVQHLKKQPRRFNQQRINSPSCGC
jgi:Mn2+/Fe2+ NRAMP family transporter